MSVDDKVMLILAVVLLALSLVMVGGGIAALAWLTA